MSVSPVDRLIGAIEDVLSREAIALQAADIAAVADAQTRIGPLIARLAELLRSGGGAVSRAALLADRIHRLQQRRRENLERLVALRAAREADRERIETARRRLKEMRPAYARTRGPRFSAAG